VPLVAGAGCGRVDAPPRPAGGQYGVPAYADVVEEVRRFLVERAEVCATAGIAATVSPSIGPRFGKERRGEYGLIANAARLADAGYPVVIGASRRASSAG